MCGPTLLPQGKRQAAKASKQEGPEDVQRRQMLWLWSECALAAATSLEGRRAVRLTPWVRDQSRVIAAACVLAVSQLATEGFFTSYLIFALKHPRRHSASSERYTDQDLQAMPGLRGATSGWLTPNGSLDPSSVKTTVMSKRQDRTVRAD